MKRKRMLVPFLVLMFLLNACGSAATGTVQTATPAPSPTAASGGFAIIGAGLNLNLSIAELKALPQVTLNTKNIDSAGNVTNVTAKGFSLTALFKDKGVDQKTLDTVSFTASDGYSIAVPKDILLARDLYVIFEYNGTVLTSPRSAVPDERAQYWVRDLVKVELSSKAAAAANSKKIILFKTAAASLQTTTLNNRGDSAVSFSLNAFSQKYLKAPPTASVLMVANDGFSKTEKAETFLLCYVTYDGSDAPLYFSETLADGMRVKGLSMVMAGDEAIFFGTQAISVKDLLKKCSMSSGKNFTVTGADGFTLLVTYDQLVKGSLQFASGGFTAVFPDVTKAGGTIKNILSIAIVD